MQLVAAIREVELADESPVVGRSRISIDDTECVFLAILPIGEQRDVRQRLSRRLAGHLRRRVECRVG